jgi:hypothetical protein
MKPIYRSISGLSVESACARKGLFKRDPANYKPSHRPGSMIRGQALHRAIRYMHDHPRDAVENAFMQEMDQIEAWTDIPIEWGAKGRDHHIGVGIKMLDYYWKANGPDSESPADVRSSERWFFIDLPMPDGSVEHIRGRFDQIRNMDGALVIVEIKTGDQKPDVARLRRDLQCGLQAYALKFGYIQIGDAPYIGPADKNYHRHDFEFRRDVGDVKVFGCKHCRAEFEYFDQWPDAVYLYHVASLLPYAKDEKKGITTPRGIPWYRIEMREEHVDRLRARMVQKINAVRQAESTGDFAPTLVDGWNSPCEGCEFSSLCDDLEVCIVKEGS